MTLFTHTQREIELIEEYRTTLMVTAVTGKTDIHPGALPAPAGVAPPTPPSNSRATQPAVAKHRNGEKNNA